MPQEIRPGLYRLEVPLPNSPLKALNSYIITGGQRNLVIDTGFNQPESLAAMRTGLKNMAIDLGRTDFFLTHLHADHTGLVGILKTDTSRLYCSAVDAKAINASSLRGPDDPWFAELAAFAVRSGFPADIADDAVSRHPGFRLGPTGPLAFTEVTDGQTLSVGDYRFICLATPGHTAGHMCLYEPSRGLLLSGDHILGDITPNISIMKPAGNPLSEYLASLARVDELDIDLVLPGHRRPFAHCRRRIAELIDHHQRRAGEILAGLAAGPKTAYQVAGCMTWDLSYRTFGEFPSPQKWFAAGEALAHLRYLEGKGKVDCREQGGVILYSLK